MNELTDRAFAVSVMAEALHQDDRWADLNSDAERRTTAKRLMAVRWAVREKRIGADDQAPSDLGDGSGYARESRGAGY